MDKNWKKIRDLLGKWVIGIIIIVVLIVLYINSALTYTEVAKMPIFNETKQAIGEHSLTAYYVDSDNQLVHKRVFSQSFSSVDELNIVAVQFEYRMQSKTNFSSYEVFINTSSLNGAWWNESREMKLHDANEYIINLGQLDLVNVPDGFYPISVVLKYRINPVMPEQTAVLGYGLNITKEEKP